jgi:hypothetical protein
MLYELVTRRTTEGRSARKRRPKEELDPDRPGTLSPPTFPVIPSLSRNLGVADHSAPHPTTPHPATQSLVIPSRLSNLGASWPAKRDSSTSSE